jgi:uncharacterized RDD family membrane protein YckC
MRALSLVQRILRSFVALRASQDDNLHVSSLRRVAPTSKAQDDNLYFELQPGTWNLEPATRLIRNGKIGRLVEFVVLDASQTILLRLAAFVIDALVVSVILVLPASILSYAMAWVGGTRSINLVWYCALLVLLLGILLRDGHRGRSIGKRILGLQLTTPDGSPCSYARSFVRNLPLLVPGWNLLELYLVITGKPFRTGDRIAKTSVIEE